MEMNWGGCPSGREPDFPQTLHIQMICDLVLTYPNPSVPPVCLLSVSVPTCLGFVRGASRNTLMYEELLWRTFGLLSLKPQEVAGSVLP